MEHTRHLEVLLAEGHRLAAVPPEALDAPVPSVPGWTLEHVVRHTGKVHRWARAALAEGPHADMAEVSSRVTSLPHGADALTAYAEALAGLHDMLSTLDPDEPAASFVGPVTARFWQRRQAHEVTVHRVDAADAVHAAGGPAPAPVPVDAAADGIDEWAHVFLATRWQQRFGAFPTDLEGRSVALLGADADVGLVLAFDGGRVTVDEGAPTADVTLRAPVELLLLTLWRRRPLTSVEVVGDRSVAERLHEIAAF